MASITTGKDRKTAGPSVRIKEIAFDAPWEWLGAGWRDLCRSPLLSLSYGALFAILSGGLVYGLTQFGWQAIVLAMAGGFLILGPMFAVGLYEISRRYEAGEQVSLYDTVFVAARSPGPLAIVGFCLLFLFGVWIRIAVLLFAIFFGTSTMPPIERFVPELLFTAHGLGMLVVGTAVGAGLALCAYMMSVVSVPMLLATRGDAFAAMSISVRAVFENYRPMLLWAAIVAGVMALGIATVFIGLVVAFPLIGHATWHAYRAVIEVEQDA